MHIDSCSLRFDEKCFYDVLISHQYLSQSLRQFQEVLLEKVF